jgi:ketosteroid isomerase-like protein
MPPTSRRPLSFVALILVAACAGHAAATGGAVPRSAGESAAAAAELLATDSAFAEAGKTLPVVDALAPMFADDVEMPAPGGFIIGRDSVLKALRANPANTTATFHWTPLRVGVSADGRHGFTFGYGSVVGPDSATTAVKYLTYWVKGAGGWHAVAYKRGRASGPPADAAPMPPALPPGSVAPDTEPARLEAFRQSLDTAERAFSRDAQQIGLKAAFARYGRPDAVNMGGPARPQFVVGADSIAAAVSQDEPDSGSSVSWAPDRVIVASSGDLGVTIGTIVANQPDSAGVTGKFPFFTVWRRDRVDEPWRYVAE